MCENCNEKQSEIDILKEENQELRDEIESLETELAQVDKWKNNCPR